MTAPNYRDERDHRRNRDPESDVAEGAGEKIYDAEKVRGGVISGRVLTVLLISLPVAFLAMFLVWIYFLRTEAPPAPEGRSSSMAIRAFAMKMQIPSPYRGGDPGRREARLSAS